MPDETRARFNTGAVAWSDYDQQPLGRIRQELTWQNLVRHPLDASDRDRPPYVPDPAKALVSLAGLLRDGGLVSVSCVNRDAEVPRRVWSRGDP